MTDTSANKVRQVKGRLTCSYAEAVFLLHRLSVEAESSALPSPLVQASVLAAIFDRETLTVFEDLKRGMVP